MVPCTAALSAFRPAPRRANECAVTSDHAICRRSSLNKPPAGPAAEKVHFVRFEISSEEESEEEEEESEEEDSEEQLPPPPPPATTRLPPAPGRPAMPVEADQVPWRKPKLKKVERKGSVTQAPPTEPPARPPWADDAKRRMGDVPVTPQKPAANSR